MATIIIIGVIVFVALVGLLIFLGDNDWGTHNKIICPECEKGGHR